jgi:hypothetical protein
MEARANPLAWRTRVMSSLFTQEDRVLPELEWPEEEDPDYAELSLLKSYATGHLYEQAITELEDKADKLFENKDFRFLYAYLLYASNQFKLAEFAISDLLEEHPDYALERPLSVYYLARTFNWQSKNVKAVKAMEEYLELEDARMEDSPEDEEGPERSKEDHSDLAPAEHRD